MKNSRVTHKLSSRHNQGRQLNDSMCHEENKEPQGVVINNNDRTPSQKKSGSLKIPIVNDPKMRITTEEKKVYDERQKKLKSDSNKDLRKGMYTSYSYQYMIPKSI